MAADPAAIGRRISSDCVALRARKLARRVSRIYDEALRPLDLKSSQLMVLAAVAARPGARPADLHRSLDLEQSTFSRNAAVLKRRGWLVARAGGDDRSQELRLTRKGAAVLSGALPRWRVAQRQASRLLGPETCRALVELADRALAAGE